MLKESKRGATASARFDALGDRLKDWSSFQSEEAKQEIADMIHELLAHRGVSRAELARRLGKSRAYVTQLLRGGTNVTIETLGSIADALDCKLVVRGLLVVKPRAARKFVPTSS